MKRRYLIIIFIFMFFMFLGLYLSDNINGIDDLFYKFIISVKSDSMTNIMKFFTFFGSTYFIIFLMIIFLIMSFIKGKLYNVINLLIIGEVIINRVVKIIVRRERPVLINLIEESSFSFPSGHTMVAVTLYGFLIHLINKSKLSKNVKLILNICLILLIGLIIISRIYLGVHYFSDCMAGIFLALAYLLIIISILERKKIV